MIGVRQVGLIARNSAALAELFRDLLGMRVVPTDTAALSPPPAADRAEPKRCKRERNDDPGKTRTGHRHYRAMQSTNSIDYRDRKYVTYRDHCRQNRICDWPRLFQLFRARFNDRSPNRRRGHGDGLVEGGCDLSKAESCVQYACSSGLSRIASRISAMAPSWSPSEWSATLRASCDQAWSGPALIAVRRTAKVAKLALLHNLGQLPEPKCTHRFC